MPTLAVIFYCTIIVSFGCLETDKECYDRQGKVYLMPILLLFILSFPILFIMYNLKCIIIFNLFISIQVCLSIPFHHIFLFFLLQSFFNKQILHAYFYHIYIPANYFCLLYFSNKENILFSYIQDFAYLWNYRSFITELYIHIMPLTLLSSRII